MASKQSTAAAQNSGLRACLGKQLNELTVTTTAKQQAVGKET